MEYAKNMIFVFFPYFLYKLIYNGHFSQKWLSTPLPPTQYLHLFWFPQLPLYTTNIVNIIHPKEFFKIDKREGGWRIYREKANCYNYIPLDRTFKMVCLYLYFV